MFEVVPLKSLGLEDKGYEYRSNFVPNGFGNLDSLDNKGLMAILKG